MGRGRAPCCDKSKVRSGPWSPSEDSQLIAFVQKHGHPNWRTLPKQAGLLRCGKSCRLRWINYLRPDVKRGNFTPEEEQTIINLHNALGNKWSRIAACLPGRTDNEIKNVWNTHLKKRALSRRVGASVDSHKTESNGSGADKSASSTSCSDSPVDTSAYSTSCSSSYSIITSRDDDDDTMGKSSSDYDYLVHESDDQVKQPCDEGSHKFAETLAYNYSCDQPNQSLYPFPAWPEDELGIEVGWDSDPDFWDLVDSLDPLQSDKPEEQQNKPGEHDAHLPGRFQTEVEYGRYLENEHGLTSDAQQLLSSKDMQPEICRDLDDFCYFSSPEFWPCSPLYSAI